MGFIIAAIDTWIILNAKACIINIVLSNNGRIPFAPVDKAAIVREIINNLHFPIHLNREGNTNGNINAGNDNDAKTNPVI